MSQKKMLSLLEALLLVSPEPLTPARAASVLDLTEAQARDYLDLLSWEYRNEGRGLQVVEVGGGYRLAVAPAAREYVRRLRDPRGGALSRAALETLALIVYRQPITRAEIEAVRGVNCESALTTLLEKGLIAEAGRAETLGRPILYRTTPYFLEYFGLNSLKELPPLEEFDIEEEA